MHTYENHSAFRFLMDLSGISLFLAPLQPPFLLSFKTLHDRKCFLAKLTSCLTGSQQMPKATLLNQSHWALIILHFSFCDGRPPRSTSKTILEAITNGTVTSPNLFQTAAPHLSLPHRFFHSQVLFSLAD